MPGVEEKVRKSHRRTQTGEKVVVHSMVVERVAACMRRAARSFVVDSGSEHSHSHRYMDFHTGDTEKRAIAGVSAAVRVGHCRPAPRASNLERSSHWIRTRNKSFPNHTTSSSAGTLLGYTPSSL